MPGTSSSGEGAMTGDSQSVSARKRRPQRHATWADPGEWKVHEVFDLKSSCFMIGDPRNGDSVAVFIVDFAPGAVVGAHSHRVDYTSVVVRGSIQVTKKVETVGSIRFVTRGTGYGPLVAGPEGCTVMEVFALGDKPTDFITAHFFDSSTNVKS